MIRAAVLALLLPLLAPPVPKVGDVVVADLSMKLDTPLGKATLTARETATVDLVTAERIEAKVVWDDLKLEIGGMSPGVPYEPATVVTRPDGTLIEIKGGLSGESNAMFHLMTRFIPWAGGATFERELPAAGELPSYKVVGKNEGPETRDGKPLIRSTETITFPGSTRKAEITAWTGADGRVVRTESKFEGLPVAALGAEISGTSTLVVR